MKVEDKYIDHNASLVHGFVIIWSRRSRLVEMLRNLDSDDSYESFSDMSGSETSLSLPKYALRTPKYRNEGTTDTSGSTRSDLILIDKVANLNDVATKLGEQELMIKSLQEERLTFLEQITQHLSTLETRERDHFELIQTYENKFNTIAQYMQQVQLLVSKLSEHLTCDLNGPASQGPIKSISNDSKPLENNVSVNGEGHDAWNQHGRSLLNELSETLHLISGKNALENSLNKQTDPDNKQPDICVGNSKQNRTLPEQKKTEGDTSTSQLRSTVCQLPVFCWKAEHVLYWLSEYVCLPGACLEAVRALKLDGKQLITMIGAKAEKQLCLSDIGLRRKYQLALEDLRIHGSPGVSRTPGPSHVTPQWVSEIWLRRYVGLAHLAPLFAFRRIDGRILASLFSYKRDNRRFKKAALRLRNHASFFSRSNRLPECNGSLIQLNNTQKPDVFRKSHDSFSVNDLDSDGRWHAASRREMNQILLGVGGDSGGGGTKRTKVYMLRKTEVRSLRTGIELLRRYNFNIELLANAQEDCESIDENLLVWTNERVAKWLKGIGLEDFTHGIEGSGLHGAFMVLDKTFDVMRLTKLLNIPVTVANERKIAEHLEKILAPARKCEGIVSKEPKFVRRQSTRYTTKSILGAATLTGSCSQATSTEPTIFSDINLINSKPVQAKRSQAIQLTLCDTEGRGNNGDDKICKEESPDQTQSKSEIELLGKFTKMKPMVSISETSAPEQDAAHNQNGRDKVDPTPGNTKSLAPVELIRSVSNVGHSGNMKSPIIKRSKDSTEDSPCYALKPNEAPTMDPFTDDTRRNRFRILLGQTPRSPTRHLQPARPETRNSPLTIGSANNSQYVPQDTPRNGTKSCQLIRPPICAKELLSDESI